MHQKPDDDAIKALEEVANEAAKGLLRGNIKKNLAAIRGQTPQAEKLSKQLDSISTKDKA